MVWDSQPWQTASAQHMGSSRHDGGVKVVGLPAAKGMQGHNWKAVSPSIKHAALFS